MTTTSTTTALTTSIITAAAKCKDIKWSIFSSI
jgi:hypothetical protein